MTRAEMEAELASTESAPRAAKLRGLLSAMAPKPDVVPAAESDDGSEGESTEPPAE